MINEALRNDDTKSHHYAQGLEIEKALKKYTLKKSITVFRGDNGAILPNGAGKSVKEIYNIAQKGLEFSVKNFVSTSATNPFKRGNVEYTIKVPKGKRGAYIKKLAHYKDENEFLLNRNTKFRVLGVTGGVTTLPNGSRYYGNKIKIDLEVID